MRISDWSLDVCSSDLALAGLEAQQAFDAQAVEGFAQRRAADCQAPGQRDFVQFLAGLELIADGHGSQLAVDTVDGAVGCGAHGISEKRGRPGSGGTRPRHAAWWAGWRVSMRHR